MRSKAMPHVISPPPERRYLIFMLFQPDLLSLTKSQFADIGAFGHKDEHDTVFIQVHSVRYTSATCLELLVLTLLYRTSISIHNSSNFRQLTRLFPTWRLSNTSSTL